jgi:hypothetical protein
MNHNKTVSTHRYRWSQSTNRPSHKQIIALERYSEPLRHGRRIRLFDLEGLAELIFCS